MHQPDRILVVDDNDAHRYAVAHVLRSSGYAVSEAGTGADARAQFANNDFDLYILDHKLPDTSGLTLCAELKSDPRTSLCPVLITSATYTAASDRAAGLERGADGYLVQPVDPQELVAQVRAMMRTRRAEQALRFSEERLALAQQAGNVGVFDHDARRGHTYWSAASERMFGLAEGGYNGTDEHWRQHIHPEDQLRTLRSIDECVRAKAPQWLQEYRIYRAGDGQMRWIEARGRLFYNSKGTLLRMVGVHLDVTDRKRLQQTLEEANQRLYLTQRAAGIGSWQWEPHTDTAVWSPEVYEIFGVDPGGPVGYAAIRKIIHHDDLAELEAAVQRSIATGEDFLYEFRIIRPDGAVRWIMSHGRFIAGRDGKLTTMYGINADITERRRTQELLLQSEQHLAAGRMASSLAHEINNPLAVITNSAFLLEGEVRDDKSKIYLGMLRGGLERAVAITRQILKLYSSDSRPNVIRVAELVEEVGTLLGDPLRDKSLKLVFRGQDNITLKGTAQELRQLIAGLVENAMEASPHGGQVVVAARRRRSREGIRLLVIDQGRGIPPEQRRHLFEPFFTTKPERGAGLGLWMCRNIARRWGGDIKVRSTSRGTCVVVTLVEAGRAKTHHA